MDQLPSNSHLRSSCVKLYLCSNPADSVVERRALRQVVFPKLGQHCRHTLGVDVRVIDPYESSHPSQWPDENTRKALIKECRESSTGPFLLALIGHDYGRPSLPALVEVSHFHMLLQQMQQAGLSTRELERVYHRDENTSPPSYCLRTACGPQEDNQIDDLMKVFETAVSLCVHKQHLTEEEALAFNRSVVDGDLRFALDNCSHNDVIRRCLVYVHKVVNPKVGQETRRSGSKLHKASYPPPTTARSSSGERDLLSDLIDNFLRSLVDSCQLVAFTTTTECDPRYGYTPARRRGYAEVLCLQVHSDLMGLIDSFVTNSVKMGSCYLSDALAREGVEQMEQCANLSRFYDVVRPEAEEIRAYVQQSDSQCPLVLTGGPCAGKTVLLAHCAQQMKAWLPDADPAVITFFTHLPHPSSVVRLLSSLCYQIIRIYDHSPSAEDFFLDAGHHQGATELRDNESSLTPTRNSALNLKTVLRSIKKPDISLHEVTQCLCFLLSLLPSSKQPLVLILDGVDQMGHNFAVELIESLPSPLLPRVKVVLSISSNHTRIMQVIKLHYPECSAHGRVSEGAKCVLLGSADRKQCVKMLMSQLSSSGRRMTSGQLALVSKALTSCCLPLYVRLLHAHTSLWCSDSDVSASCLPDSIHSSIAALLNQLEHKHTSCLVARAVSYLTLCSVGLTEAELADLLSRVESCHVTQVDVEKLLLDLNGFLIRRTAMGCQVLFWVSRHFGLVVAKTYLCTGEARGEIHSEMADYFSRGWNFASTTALSNTEREDRNTEDQPSLRDLANARRALELMHHLRQSNRLEIRTKVLISWRFHLVLVQAGHLKDLVAMLRQDEEEESRNFLRERRLLASILMSSWCLLQRAPLELSTLMEASLLPYLELFPVLRAYVGEIRTRGCGLAVALSPAPDTVVCLWRLEHDSVLKPLSVTAAAGTQCGTIAEVMSDGSAWIWRDLGCGIVRLSLCQEKSEIKFAGVKSSHQFMLFSTQCNKLFLWDVTAPDMLVEVKSPHTLNLVEGFVACEKRLCVWWERESVLDLFDASNATLSNLHCQSCVTCVVFSSGGSHIYCGQEEGTVSIFDIHCHSVLFSCSHSNHSAVVSIILSENNQEMACIGKTGGVTLWDITAEKQSPRLVKENSAGIECIDILNTDYSNACSSLLLCHSKHITVWDTCEWEMCDQFLAPQDGAFIQAVFSQDGHLLLALLDACPRVLVWRVSTGLCVLSLDANEPPHILLKTTSEIVCVAEDGRLIAWDTEMIYIAGAAPKMVCGVEEVVVEQTGCWFYTADGSEMVWRWSFETGLPHSSFLHDSSVKKVRLSRDDVTLVTLSGEEIYVWQTGTGQNIFRICGSGATDILITPNSNFGVSISEHGLSRVWKLAHGSVVCTVHLYLCDAQVSPESTFLIGRHGGDLLAASLWSGMISKCFSRVESSEDVITFHTLSQHPDFVVVMVASGVIYTWKMSDETVCRHFQLPETFYCQPQHFQMTSDGSFALLSTDNAAITLLDVAQVRLCSFKAEGSVMKACLDETGCYIAYISHPISQEKRCVCTHHTQPILTIAQLSDGKKVGRVFLCKDPLTLLIHGQQYVFVGFRDGSVGVYSISGHMVRGVDGIGYSENLSRQLKGCFFDTVPMTWFPLATPNMTWP
ncbi:NACHT and WD repeat domain-containing protein 2-like isoform X2 [Dunckerocampus dactyliophorus]|uniref:NACHT and WD repeat domain-containing protein 2-like isoform X2 n=1 Tax=Dunckerocampus dactyliophorus TaxID=161453 RepID=UPI002405B050|nr:NACHT and WD repeat domain-containing protein 2-like isoform X2 [Dunckerocampus dactyliophorus]